MMRAFCVCLFAIISTGALALDANLTKKRVLIISLMNDVEVDAFYTLLEQTNPNIDGSSRPTSLDESDVVVYLLDSWDVAQNVPGARELPIVFESVYKVKSPILRHNVFGTTADGRILHFVFYSLFDNGYPPIKCFALDIAVEAKRQQGEFFETSILQDCAD